MVVVQCGRTWSGLHVKLDFPPPPTWAAFGWQCGQAVINLRSERETSKAEDPPAVGHMCWAQEQRNPPKHRDPGSHSFSHTCQPENHRETLSESGSSFRRRQINCTFYILHYLWLCTICWYPDDGVHVWNIWYLAFSRWHEIKCIIHRVTSVLATVVTNPLSGFILSPRFGFT